MVGCFVFLMVILGLSGLVNCLIFFPLGILWGLPMAVVGFGFAAFIAGAAAKA